MTCETNSRIACLCICGAEIDGDCHVVKLDDEVYDLRCAKCCDVCSARDNGDDKRRAA